MGNKLETALEETISEVKCGHYWIIKMPQGPTCRGICHFYGGKGKSTASGLIGNLPSLPFTTGLG